MYFQSKLQSFLNNPGIVLLPQMNYLLSNTYRSKIQHRAYEVIIAVYKQLYKYVHDPANMYKDPSVLMPQSPEEIQQILLCININ